MPLKTRPRCTIVVAILVVLAFVAASIAYVYTSPKYSWNAAVRDHDGDGVPDKTDPRPFDDTIWASGTGLVYLTIRNNYSCSIEFLVYSSYDQIHNYLQWVNSNTSSGGDVSNPFSVSWLIGQNETNLTVHVQGNTLTGESWPAPTSPISLIWQQNLVVRNGENLTLSITFPNDFHTPN